MIFGVAAAPAVTPHGPAAQTGQGAAQVQPAPQAVLDLQRVYGDARARREPVTQLLADAFTEIQADGRALTRAQAVYSYTRFDDVSAGLLSERRTASYGDVVIVAGRTGEEGTPYSARRLYVWVNENRTWRLLVFQKTFVRSRGAKLSPVSADWPAEYRNGQLELSEEQTFATRDPALLRGLVADDAMVVDGYGEHFTGRAWLAQLNETKDSPLNLRGFSLLYQGEADVAVGNEGSSGSSIASRFTRVWTRAPQGIQLRVSQTTLAAAEVFSPQR
jgi:hypothetical protein